MYLVRYSKEYTKFAVNQNIIYLCAMTKTFKSDLV